MNLKITRKKTIFTFIALLVVTMLASSGLAAFSYDLDNLTYDYGVTGSVDRSIFDKAKETISVKDFGAVGDGSTDDTTAIQDAIDYVSTRGKAGIVLLPRGTYKITSTIDVNVDGVTLLGQGGNAASDYGTCIYNASNQDAIEISKPYSGVKNLCIYQSNPTGGYAVVIDNTTEAFADMLKLDNVFNGIKTLGCTSVHISDIIFKNPVGSYGINLEGSTAGADGVYVKRIRGTTTDTSFTWFHTTGDVASVYVTDCYFENGNRGIYLEKGDADETNPKYIYTHNIIIQGTRSEGIKITSGSTHEYTNTAVYDCGSNGASGWYVSGFYAHMLMNNCSVIGSSQHGILIEDGKIISIANAMVGNNSTSSANSYDGIRIGGTNVDEVSIIGGCYGKLYNATNNQNYGIRIYGSYHDKIAITGTDVSGNNNGIADLTSSSKVKFIRDNAGNDNPGDGTIPFEISGSLSASTTYFCEYVYGRKFKITGLAGKVSSGSCSIKLSVDGTLMGELQYVNTSGQYVTFAAPVEIDATSAGKRIEVYVSGNNNASGLEGGFSFTNLD